MKTLIKNRRCGKKGCEKKGWELMEKKINLTFNKRINGIHFRTDKKEVTRSN